MPIEFPCDQCRNLLRVTDVAAGQLARCPKCGNIGRVPGDAGAGPGSATPPAAAPPPARKPFPVYAEPGRGQPGAAPGGGANPYALPPGSSYPVAPGVFAPPTLATIRAKVNGPGIAMIVLGSFSLTLFLLYGSMAAYGVMTKPAAADDWGLFAIFCGLLLIKGLPMLYGGIQIMRLKNHGAAMVGAVVALLPCYYCWFAELGFGIWALVVLSDPLVTAAFRRPAESTGDTGSPFGPQPM